MTKRPDDCSELKEFAQSVLLENWRDGYTIPSPKLYPFQWLWDSGFIALGYMQFDVEKALLEIRSLFKGQWQNGMLPHIIFHEESDTYFPGPDVWKSHLNPAAPQNPNTSGITQPPVIGFILERIYRQAAEKQPIVELIEEVLPKLEQFHRYFYEERDPNDEGLVYIRHNWESGLDNAAVWDDALETISHSDRDLSDNRKDLEHIDASQRPGNKEYQQYLALVHLYRDCNYDEAEIYQRCPFLIQDPLTNALLIESNSALARLAKIVNSDHSTFEEWAKLGTKAMNDKLWDDDTGTYMCYDLNTKQHVKKPYLTGFAAALFAGIPSEQQFQQFLEKQLSAIDTNEYYLLPTEPPQSDFFEPRRYWRGPVWININWLFYHGLKKYGQHDQAENVRADIITLIEEFGFFEYYNPIKTKAEGYGTDQFSWSAALYLDLLDR